MKESWRQLQAASRASTGARPQLFAGEEHQPSSIQVLPKLLVVFSLPLLPFQPCPEQPQHGDMVTFLQPFGLVTVTFLQTLSLGDTVTFLQPLSWVTR